MTDLVIDREPKREHCHACVLGDPAPRRPMAGVAARAGRSREARRTIDAHPRGLAEYLEMRELAGVDPLTAIRAGIGVLVRELTERPSRRGASIVAIDSGAVRRFPLCQAPLGSCLPIQVTAATLTAILLAVYLANTAILQLWLTTRPGTGPRTRIRAAEPEISVLAHEARHPPKVRNRRVPPVGRS